WIKTLFSYFSAHILSITLAIVAILGLAILYFEHKKLKTLKINNFFYMLIESVCYAFILALLLSSFVTFLFQMAAPQGVEQLSMIQKIALSLGAGLYEELFFRVILVSGLLYIFKFFAQNNAAFLLSIITAALLFSAVHYVGPLGDSFTAASFVFRFLFGLALNILYLRRGFGVAAWTHAFYDIMVIALS
ncbi:MAG TPA: CPBP family glutamic-type intramembrane protease, partial [Balneolaceae bacterium]|nr:CPBP family glutamic-type intramembrane protease [Balneolaceae bacterium]